VISTYFSQDAFALMLSLTSAMTLIPYLFVAAYGFKVSKSGEGYATEPQGRQSDLIMAGVAVFYTIFMIYAGGLKFLLLSAVLYAPGTLLYIWSRREQNQTVFHPVDWAVFGVAVVGAVVGIYGLATGTIAI
jgi:arginine:ornithine antiporter/lysine permease